MVEAGHPPSPESLRIARYGPLEFEGLRNMRSASVRNLVGMVLTAMLLTGVGSGVFHVGQALAAPGTRRIEMLAAGIDMMPIGTAKQVDRLKRMRFQKP